MVIQGQKISIPRADGNKIPAILYIPSNIDSSKKYPVVIYLHGRGEEGDGTMEGLSKLYNSKNHENLVKFAEERKFIVVAPQFIPAYNGWIPDGAGGKYDDDVVEWVKASPITDISRIYLTGISGGGGSVWDYLKTDPSHAKKIAAALIICGTQVGGNSSYIVDANLPLWAFHAEDDGLSVNFTINQVVAINILSPLVPAKMTIFPTGGHAIWPTVYGDSSVYDWLLAQKRETSSSTTTTTTTTIGKTIVSKMEITVYSDGTVDTKLLI